MDLDIVYEDEWILIVNKSAGIAIHPSVLHYSDSLCNGIKYYFNSISLNKKIRPVNRLDFNTSGLVIFAKCEYIQECLISQMKKNLFKKEYLAICEGSFDIKSDTISLPIARKDNSIIERCISENGQQSITHYEVLKEFKNYTLIKCILETGRTHQIRVHLSAIGHPLLGDTLYGNKSDLINRQALHCYKLKFIHPITLWHEKEQICKPGSVFKNSHLSRIYIAIYLKPRSSRRCRADLIFFFRCCSRWGLHSPLCHHKGGELLPRLFTLTNSLAVIFCCTFLRVAPTRRYLASLL